MATFSEKSLVDKVIAGGGWLPEYPDHDAPDNPQCIKVVEYTTAHGGTAWGMVFTIDTDPKRYERPTDYVINPKVIWEAQNGS